MQKILVGIWVKIFTFSILSSQKQNLFAIVFSTTELCTIVFSADTGKNRKIVNCAYSCLYAKRIKVASVDYIIRIYYYMLYYYLLLD